MESERNMGRNGRELRNGKERGVIESWSVKGIRGEMEESWERKKE